MPPSGCSDAGATLAARRPASGWDCGHGQIAVGITRPRGPVPITPKRAAAPCVSLPWPGVKGGSLTSRGASAKAWAAGLLVLCPAATRRVQDCAGRMVRSDARADLPRLSLQRSGITGRALVVDVRESVPQRGGSFSAKGDAAGGGSCWPVGNDVPSPGLAAWAGVRAWRSGLWGHHLRGHRGACAWVGRLWRGRRRARAARTGTRHRAAGATAGAAIARAVPNAACSAGAGVVQRGKRGWR